MGRTVRYWYTYRTAVAVVLALLLSGVIYWLYTQQVVCDEHAAGCVVNVSVHPEDRLFANQDDPGPGVVIVGIDDKSVQALGHFPVPRENYAKAIHNLQQAGALVVGLDVQLSDPSGSDDSLTAVLRQSTVPVVLSYPASNLAFTSPGKVIQCPPGTAVCKEAGNDEIPLKQFRCLDANPDQNVACVKPIPNVVLASTDLVLDGDGVLRSVPLFVQPACYPRGICDTAVMDTFAFATYRASLPDFQTLPALQESDGTASFGSAFKMAVDSKGAALINFSGPPDTFKHFGHYASFSDVANGTAPAGLFKDNIVLIGAYNLSGVNDAQLVTTSAGSNGTLQMAGVEIHANVVRMLNRAVPLPGNPSLLLTPEPQWLLFLLILVLGLATAIGVSRVSVLWGLAGTAGALVVFTFAMAGLASFNNFVADVFHPWLAIALTYAGVTA
ncbi:MAG TPA: CHASE2 domain-containing protein, partial [Candidatus Dormibacteraeota bacterium]